MKNKISISFIKYPKCNLIKLLWDAANQLQVSWNQRIVQLSKKCGFRHSHCHQQLRPLSRNTRKTLFYTSNLKLFLQIISLYLHCYSHLPYSPKPHRRESNTDRTRMNDSPGSMSPSVHSSEERPRSRVTSHASRPQSQPSRNGNRY